MGRLYGWEGLMRWLMGRKDCMHPSLHWILPARDWGTESHWLFSVRRHAGLIFNSVSGVKIPVLISSVSLFIAGLWGINGLKTKKEFDFKTQSPYLFFFILVRRIVFFWEPLLKGEEEDIGPTYPFNILNHASSMTLGMADELPWNFVETFMVPRRGNLTESGDPLMFPLAPLFSTTKWIAMNFGTDIHRLDCNNFLHSFIIS